jgi:hypothetical protein
MGWLRSNRRLGGYLWLTAFALQAVISFGHLHVGVRRDASIITIAAGAPASHPLPARHDSGQSGYCANCATISLTANSFVPLVPQLAVALVSQRIEHFSHPILVFVAPSRTPFQSRAPPLA